MMGQPRAIKAQLLGRKGGDSWTLDPPCCRPPAALELIPEVGRALDFGVYARAQWVKDLSDPSEPGSG